MEQLQGRAECRAAWLAGATGCSHILVHTKTTLKTLLKAHPRTSGEIPVPCSLGSGVRACTSAPHRVQSAPGAIQARQKKWLHGVFTAS